MQEKYDKIFYPIFLKMELNHKNELNLKIYNIRSLQNKKI